MNDDQRLIVVCLICAGLLFIFIREEWGKPKPIKQSARKLLRQHVSSQIAGYVANLKGNKNGK